MYILQRYDFTWLCEISIEMPEDAQIIRVDWAFAIAIIDTNKPMVKRYFAYFEEGEFMPDFYIYKYINSLTTSRGIEMYIFEIFEIK